MLNLSPLLIATAIIVSFGIVAVVVLAVRNQRTFHGYGEIASEARKVAAQLRGEVFRDGENLVVSGEYEGIPAILRFSNSDNMPAMSLETRIPSTVGMSIVPRDLSDNRPGSRVRLNSLLEQRFSAKSREPLEAAMFVQHKGVMDTLVRVCCSRKTVVEFGAGKMHLFEMVIPDSLSRHVLDHMSDIRVLSRALENLPGADKIKIARIPRERSSWAFRAAVAAGLVVAAISVMAATMDRTKPVRAAVGNDATFRGMVKADATLIPFADQWHLTNTNDFDIGFLDWLNSLGEEPQSRVIFDPDQSGPDSGVAYLLTNQHRDKRLVVLVDHRLVFDSSFRNIAGIARVPASAMAKLQLDSTGKVHKQASGDAILVVRNGDDPRSAVLLYIQNGSLQSACPPNYRSIGAE